MRYILPIIEDQYYHIYNCGINGTSIFQEERNYYYFIKQYQKYCSECLETYAYALMNNHFHLLVRIKAPGIFYTRPRLNRPNQSASKQLSHFFNGYAQAYNKAYNRHGKLFETPFKRKLIQNDAYLINLIRYIHYNPQKHDFVSDFRDWPFTSWHELTGKSNTFLERERIWDLYGNQKNFIESHLRSEENLVMTLHGL